MNRQVVLVMRNMLLPCTWREEMGLSDVKSFAQNALAFENISDKVGGRT